MVQLTDSTRRLLLFIMIVVGGSVLLLFDIPVVYLMAVVILLACLLLVVTGAILLGDVIRELRYLLKNRKPKVKKQKQKKESKPSSPSEGSARGRFSLFNQSGKQAKPKKEKKSVLSSLSKDARTQKKPDDKKDKKQKEGKTEPPVPKGKTPEPPDDQQAVSKKKEEEIDDDLLDDFDIDLDLDSELDGMNPEDDFEKIRTPFADDAVMEGTTDIGKLDIATSEEEEDIIIDTNAVGDDDIDSIYSSALDTGSDSNPDILSNMDGGGTISGSDISTYSAGDDDSFGGYGGDENEEGEEVYELGFGGGSTDDDDLIASLKADINDMKEKDDDCLLRDLKDIEVSAQEIQDELLDIMNIITKRIKKR